MVFPYYIPRPTHLSVDTSQKYFEEDDSGLDDTLLDHNTLDSGLEMSPPMVSSRRDSFALSSALLSPKQEDWQSVDMQSNPSGNPFESTNPFMRMDYQAHHHLQHPSQHQQTTHYQHQQHHQPHQQHQQHHPQHQGSWPMMLNHSAHSGAATPAPRFDALSSDYQATSIFHRGPLQPPTPFGSATGLSGGLFTPINSSAMAPSAPTSASAAAMQHAGSQSSGSGRASDTRSLPPQSPPLPSHNEMHRGDGVRKKNARCDIPRDRNLDNIDLLIAESTDDHLIKELKQQKRLLRNRQAALDSRQRKKQHTERLEGENKHYTGIINEMEQSMERLKTQVSELLQEKQTFNNFIESLNLEKEEMIRRHTLETGDLRKKISLLTGHIEAMEGAASSTGMSSNSAVYSGDAHDSTASAVGPFGNMEGLSLDGSHAWEGAGLFHDITGDQQLQHADTKPSMQLVQSSRKAATDAADNSTTPSEKPTSQGGMLFLLFLVGAFVLSSRQTPSIPRVSEDVRVASATLLENVLKDAGIAHAADSLGAAPAPSSAAGAAIRSTAAAVTPWAEPSGSNLVIEPSMLGKLSDQLLQPTEEQTNNQLFSLSADEYSGVVQQHHPQASDRDSAATSTLPASQGRRNLAEALASMRSNSKAEVYTRSLLWDQIPSDVVRTFAKMVEECNTQSAASSER